MLCSNSHHLVVTFFVGDPLTGWEASQYVYIYVLHFIRLIECSEPLFISRCQILPYNIHLAFGSSR